MKITTTTTTDENNNNNNPMYTEVGVKMSDP
jgi:hypothetical protein